MTMMMTMTMTKGMGYSVNANEDDHLGCTTTVENIWLLMSDYWRKKKNLFRPVQILLILILNTRQYYTYESDDNDDILRVALPTSFRDSTIIPSSSLLHENRTAVISTR
mmetsp:Transcript_47262/g.52676  ORF Transcript_47262/g.52676 Transcript_47262/m.52676 type:complete len:109 (+) Transcript_47262:79-405(+)